MNTMYFKKADNETIAWAVKWGLPLSCCTDEQTIVTYMDILIYIQRFHDVHFEVSYTMFGNIVIKEPVYKVSVMDEDFAVAVEKFVKVIRDNTSN